MITDAHLQQLEDLSGENPHELLLSAQAAEASKAVGRFADYAASGKGLGPINELHSAATTCLVNREQEKKRLEMSAQQGRAVANLSRRVASASGNQASLIAANQDGTRALIDQSSQDHCNRKRARDEAFGSNEKDVPVRKCVRWDWKGQTTAAAACWQENNGNDDSSSGQLLPTHKFKCRVVMQGSDVFAGMRSLMEAGLMEGPLPHYVKDAASLGEGGIISVDHGAVRVRANKQG